jgi:RNA-splicing ligase RtcB
MKSVVKTVGEVNKELKNKIIEVEKEIISVREANKNLEERLTKSREQNKKCKAYILEQNQKNNSYALEQQSITEKANELYKMKTKEHETSLEEIVELKLNLKEKKKFKLKNKMKKSAL